MNAPGVNKRPGPADGETISSTLLLKLKAADPNAWERLVNLYEPEVYRWCRLAKLQPKLQPEDARDVTQEVFQRVLQYVNGFSREHAGQSFGGWMWTITQHQIADWCRRNRRQTPGRGGTTAHLQLQEIADVADSSTSSAAIRNEFGIQAVLDRIRPEFEQRTWEAFRRMCFDGEAAADIGRQLDMDKHTVRQAKFRVMKRLRKELEEEKKRREEG